MKIAALALAAVLAIAGCATISDQRGPVPVEGQPDTLRFKIYPAIGVPESAVDQAVRVDFEDYRAKNAYRSYAVLNHRFNYAPTYYEYTVHFEK
jgi:hypothetical protein